MRKISLEIIEYQNKDTFPKKLSGLVSNIYSEIDKEVYKTNNDLINKSSFIPSIERLIKERFNLNVPFDKELHEYIPAAIIPFLSDYLTEATSLKNLSAGTLGSIFGSVNIFKHIRELEKEKEEYFKRINNRKGFVDLKNARVGGYLADVKNYIIINFFVLKAEGLTPEEVTAVMLHEIGHAFVGLESHHRLSTSNLTIMEILDNINNNKQDKALYLFKKHFNEKDLKEASLGKTEIVDFYGRLANKYIGELNSQFINGKYDQTNYENMADSFATRFNTGKDLVSGLNKLHKNYGHIFENNRVTFITLYTIDLLLTLMLLVLTFPIGPFIAAYIIICVFNGNNSHMTYDFPVERYNRIKNSITNNLKNINLPKDFTKQLLEQYMFIDEVINKSDMFKGVLHRLSDYIVPSNRDNNYYIDLQIQIENTVNNDLFVKSQQIRVS